MILKCKSITSLLLFTVLLEKKAQGNDIAIDAGLIPSSKERIQEINNKMDIIANNLLLSKSSQNKKAILNKLEKKLIKAARRLGYKGDEHVQLIMDGIKSKAFNNTQEDQKVDLNLNNSFINIISLEDLSRKIDSFVDNELKREETLENKKFLLDHIKEKLLESVNKKQDEIQKNIKILNDTRRNYIDEVESFTNTEIDVDNKNQLSQTISPATPPSCYNIDVRTCDDIKNINKVKCWYDLGYITLDKLCDGTSDCPSKSDEKNCIQQVMKRVYHAEILMDNIEQLLYRKCFENDNSRFVLSNQAEILQGILNRRLLLKERCKILNLTLDNKVGAADDGDDYKTHLKKAANEIAVLISALALSFHGTLCSHQVHVNSRRRNSIFKLDVENLEETIWPPKDCKCEKGICDSCTINCKRVCWQKHSLTKWNCDSVNNSATVSINALCDGKIDCFDESDERNCVQGLSFEKFEASELYSSILKMLRLKAAKERPPAQKKMLSLINLIIKLQKTTTRSSPSETAIRRLRNKCYYTLSSIYTDILNNSFTVSETEDTYTFLLALNQKLGAALKRSNTGNTKVIKGNECQCRNGTCSVSFCSKVCEKACSVEPKLMKYYCNEALNRSVAISKLCDNVEDCPQGSDEMNCKTDVICRRHHLVVLRHNLEKVGENLKGTALGELLFVWKTKVISTLKVAEKNERPTPKIMKTIVEEILRDLVMSYGSVRDYRRSNTEYALGEFLMISQIVLESLKTCGK